MRALLRPCSHPGCPNLVSSGRCRDHERQYRAAHRSGFEWVYTDPRWRALRRRVREEQPTCTRIVDGVRCDRPWTDLDHKVALQDGGQPFARDNVHGLCHEHHAAKTMDEIRGRAII